MSYVHLNMVGGASEQFLGVCGLMVKRSSSGDQLKTKLINYFQNLLRAINERMNII